MGLLNQELLYKEIGQRIREARDKKEWTQQELAEKVNLTRTSITNIEQGKQKLLVHVLYEFAVALDIPPTELLAPKGTVLSENNVKQNEKIDTEGLTFINLIKSKRK